MSLVWIEVDSLTTSFVEDLDTSTSGLKGVPLLDSHLIEGEERGRGSKYWRVMKKR